jgi:hypothetical protein
MPTSCRRALLDAMRAEKRLFPSVKLHDAAAPRMEFGEGGPGRPIQPRLHDLAQRREWLTKARVDHQLIGGWTDVYGYDLPPAEGADWARFYNEHMAKDAASRCRQLGALATVPLQDGKLAAKVLDEALDAGFHGAMIATQPKGDRRQPRRQIARSVLGGRLGAQRRDLSAPALHLQRRSARRLRSDQRGRAPRGHDDRGGAAVVLRPSDAVSGGQSACCRMPAARCPTRSGV